MGPRPRILITAGPTREPIDSVRFIGNRSSGRLGVALAHAAASADGECALLAGPGVDVDSLPSSVGVERFESTQDLQERLRAHETAGDWDVLIMAAAVADYRPVSRSNGKLPRDEKGRMMLELTPTPDLVADVARRRRSDQRIVAFALEPADELRTRAMEKMRRKDVQAIVANPLETMERATIDATLFTIDGAEQSPGEMSKSDFAVWLLSRLLDLTPKLDAATDAQADAATDAEADAQADASRSA